MASDNIAFKNQISLEQNIETTNATLPSLVLKCILVS